MDRGHLKIVDSEATSKPTEPMETATAQKKSQRAHRPEELGSRVFKKKSSGWYYGDFRWRDGGRQVLRDPEDPRWPEAGAKTSKKSEAERWAKTYDKRWKADLEEAEQRRTGKFRTLRLGVEAFLEHRKAQSAPSTYSGSRTALTHLGEAVGPEADPASITDAELQSVCDDFLNEGYKASSVWNTRNHWVKFFDFHKIEPNPARDLVIPKVDPNDVQPWDEEERERIREAASALDSDHDVKWQEHRRLAEYLFSSGTRIQECAAADWQSIDPHSKTVRVTKQISRTTNRGKKTKGGDARTAVMLQEWWPLHETERSGLLFCNDLGKPIRYRKLYDHVVAVLERAGLKKPGEAAHQFRHTYAFLFLKRGGTMDQLSKSLGHKRVSTTQEYYDHFDTDHAAEAGVERIYGAESIRRGPRGG